jgi:transposase
MRPVCVFANASSREIEQLREDLRGRWRQAARAVMVLLSLHGLSAAQIGDLLGCHPATVRRWIGRCNTEGLAGLAGRPRCGRPPLGGKRLATRIAALLQGPGPWTLPRIWRYLGRPQVSLPRLELLYGARYSPHDNPVERVWGGLKNYVANTAVTWPGRRRQIHSYFRNRSPAQMLDTAAPWTSPWLPPRYEQNFWNAA